MTRPSPRQRAAQQRWRDYYESSAYRFVSFDEWIEMQTTPWPMSDAEIAATLHHQDPPNRLEEASMTKDIDRLAEPIWSNTQWSITTFGMRAMLPNGFIIYEIPTAELAELRYPEQGIAKWPLQLAAKNWIDLPAFMEAWRKALDVHHPGGLALIDMAATEDAARRIKEGERFIPQPVPFRSARST